VDLDARILRIDHLRGGGRESLTDSDWRVVMVTDVVGSTAVSRQLGDVSYYQLVMRHHELVRHWLAEWGGHEFSESGDGLLAWFYVTEDAANAAVDIQVDLAGGPPVSPRLELRVALAGGAPLFHGGRPYGLVLNRAARLLVSAQPGQIVVDEAVADQLAATAIDSSTLVDLRGIGAHRVATLDAGQLLHQRRTNLGSNAVKGGLPP
jgi:class 3 adenylate cyclase